MSRASIDMIYKQRAIGQGKAKKATEEDGAPLPDWINRAILRNASSSSLSSGEFGPAADGEA